MIRLLGRDFIPANLTLPTGYKLTGIEICYDGQTLDLDAYKKRSA